MMLWDGMGALVALAVLLWLAWRARNQRLLRLAARVPGPPALPLLGNALLFMAKPNEQLKLIGDILAKYGDYVKFWLGPDLNIVVKNPADIKLLLTSNKVNQKGPLYNHMKPMIGPGILSGETLMGLSKDDSRSLQHLNEWVKETPRMYSLIYAKMTKWWLQLPLIFWLTGAKREYDYFKDLGDKLSEEIVDKRRKALEKNVKTDEEVRSAVDRFILSGELTKQQIKSETLTVLTTSQEASAKIASTIFLVLAHLPEWQTKVYNEIQERVGTESELITEEQIKSLKYLDMVFKEVLRYASIAALIQRTVEEEITINSGNIVLPAGTSLVIPIHILHRDPRHWPDPDTVKPERFLPQNEKLRDANAFVPFSLGHMDCLGRVYATHLVKTLVVRVLQQVRFEAEGRLEDLELDVAISVSFSDGYNVRAYPRPKNSRLPPSP